MASAAPDSDDESVVSKSPNQGRLEKREARLRAVLDKQIRIAKLSIQLIPVFSNASRWPERIRTFARLKRAREAWISIQSGRSYGSRGMWNTRWEISVHGIDEGARRAGIDPPPWVYDSRGQKLYRKVAAVSVATATGRFCERCQRSTNLPVCRQCGASLSSKHRPLESYRRYAGIVENALPRSTARDWEAVAGPSHYASLPLTTEAPPAVVEEKPPARGRKRRPGRKTG